MLCPQCFRDYQAVQRFCPFDGARLSAMPLRELLQRRGPSVEGLYGGRYVVRGALGRGAMASVYLGEDLFTNDSVAIKVLDQRNAGTPGVRERFLREAQAMARLSHPHIVKTYAAGDGPDGMPYIVLEVLSGETLGALLRRDPVLPIRVMLSVLCQIASALVAAHAASVVHRDVKPDNIFLLGDPGDPYGVKLLDFGLAKVENSAHTQAGIAVGTAAYMAPEQVVSEAVDGRTDVYGLGVSMFRLFTGRLPFESEGVEVLAQQLIAPPPSPRGLAPKLTLHVERVILTALRKCPENRYATMAAMLEDLERLSGKRPGEPVGAPLQKVPDVYQPRTSYGRTASTFLYRQIKQTPPVWDDLPVAGESLVTE